MAFARSSLKSSEIGLLIPPPKVKFALRELSYRYQARFFQPKINRLISIIQLWPIQLIGSFNGLKLQFVSYGVRIPGLYFRQEKSGSRTRTCYLRRVGTGAELSGG